MLWLETILAHPQISDNGAWLPKGKANDFVTGFIYLGKNLWIVCQQPVYVSAAVSPFSELLWQSPLAWSAKLGGIRFISLLLSLGHSSLKLNHYL